VPTKEREKKMKSTKVMKQKFIDFVNESSDCRITASVDESRLICSQDTLVVQGPFAEQVFNELASQFQFQADLAPAKAEGIELKPLASTLPKIDG
jgi:hypothetical protein